MTSELQTYFRKTFKDAIGYIDETLRETLQITVVSLLVGVALTLAVRIFYPISWIEGSAVVAIIQIILKKVKK